jgi:hypothetical protein
MKEIENQFLCSVPKGRKLILTASSYPASGVGSSLPPAGGLGQTKKINIYSIERQMITLII